MAMVYPKEIIEYELHIISKIFYRLADSSDLTFLGISFHTDRQSIILTSNQNQYISYKTKIMWKQRIVYRMRESSGTIIASKDGYVLVGWLVGWFYNISALVGLFNAFFSSNTVSSNYLIIIISARWPDLVIINKKRELAKL